MKSVAKKRPSYDANSIVVSEGLTGLRRKISMYTGSSDSDAVFHIWKEGFDNSADEHSAGHNTYIKVVINTTGTVIIADKGRGIPVDVKKETGNPVILDVLSKLHSSGKFAGSAYTKGTIGTHGVGIKATNALSLNFEVWTYRNEEWYHIGFEKGVLKNKLNTKTKRPIEIPNFKQGTIIRYTADLDIFDKGSKLNIKKVKEYCQLQAFLHPGLKIDLKTPKNEYEFHEKEGLKSLLTKQIAELGEESLGKPFIYSVDPINIALNWSKNSGENIKSYASGSFTRDGGTHVTGLNNAIRDAIQPYKGKAEFVPAEIRDGLVGTLNLSVIEPKFSSQAKERLTTEEATKIVYDLLKPAFDEFFKSNKTLTKTIVQRAADLHKSYAKFTADRKNIAALKNKNNRAMLSSKLSKAKTKDTNKIELFLVEGDSAGGTAKQGRDQEYQAVLALRGKVLNAYRASPDKLFANNEIQNICMAVGYEDEKFTIDKLKVGRIILLADPDVDGSHITNLLLSFFQKIMPEAYTKHKIYIVDGSLFYCQFANGNKIYGNSVKEVEAQVTAKKLKIPQQGVQRIKGWGEVDPDVLIDVAFDKKTRKLLRIMPAEGKDRNKFVKIVGDDTSERKVLLGV